MALYVLETTSEGRTHTEVLDVADDDAARSAAGGPNGWWAPGTAALWRAQDFARAAHPICRSRPDGCWEETPEEQRRRQPVHVPQRRLWCVRLGRCWVAGFLL
jgi:hypothetical protein